MIKIVYRKYSVKIEDIIKTFKIEGSVSSVLLDGVYLVIKTSLQDSTVVYKICPREFMTKFQWKGDDGKFISQESTNVIVVVEVTEMFLEGDT